MRKTLIPAILLAGLVLLVPARPAHAVSKEIIQLQTQVQGLQDMLQTLQRSNSEQMGVLQNLIQQSNDNVNKMVQQMTALQAKVDSEGQNSPLSGQIQSLNDSVDELKTRLDRINTAITGMQSQLQNVNAPPAAGAPAQQPATGGAAPTTDQQQAPPMPQGGGTNVPLTGAPGGNPGAAQPQQPQPPAGSPQAQAPPVGQLIQSAVNDYNGARYDLAAGEFSDVIKYYPQSEQAGNASFYLGEIAYRQGLYPAAIKNYDIVLEQYPGSAKAPASQLRKGEAELASEQRNAGIRDLRSLVARYPMSPEGAQARSLLNGMGVRLSANKPSAYHAE